MTTKNMVQKATNLLGLYSDSQPWRIAVSPVLGILNSLGLPPV